MLEFEEWLKLLEDRVVFVSDNNGYDSQWVNYYFDKHSIENPFGHSSRRISDFWEGLNNSWMRTQDWKNFRIDNS